MYICILYDYLFCNLNDLYDINNDLYTYTIIVCLGFHLLLITYIHKSDMFSFSAFYYNSLLYYNY